jgi:hypothetical protein
MVDSSFNTGSLQFFSMRVTTEGHRNHRDVQILARYRADDPISPMDRVEVRNGAFTVPHIPFLFIYTTQTVRNRTSHNSGGAKLGLNHAN